jgi:hypothetical protein
MIYNNAKSILGFWRVSIFMAIIVDILFFFLIFIGTLLLLLLAHQNIDQIDPGQLGFSLLLLIQTGDNFLRVYYLLIFLF